MLYLLCGFNQNFNCYLHQTGRFLLRTSLRLSHARGIPGWVDGVKSSPQMRPKSSRTWPKTGTFGSWGKTKLNNQTCGACNWKIVIISQSFWEWAVYYCCHLAALENTFCLWGLKCQRHAKTFFLYNTKNWGKAWDFFFKFIYLYFILYFWLLICVWSQNIVSHPFCTLLTAKLFSVSSMARPPSYNFRNIDWLL